jgi:hypothetical protein
MVICLAFHGDIDGFKRKKLAAFFCRLKLLGYVVSNLRTRFGQKSKPFGVSMHGGVETFGTGLA